MRQFQLTLTCSFLFMTSLCLGQKVREKDWVQLFNGKDLSNWSVKITGHPLNDNYGNTFRVVNGNMAVNYDQYQKFDEQYGHIFYNKPFSAYLLVVEYRFVDKQVAGGPGWAIRNSGAMLHSQDPKTMSVKQDFPISLETQFLGGDGQHERHTANLCTPGTNVVLDGKLFTPHCIDSKSKTYAGEQWVRAEMLVLGDSLVQHIMDGDTVLSYTKPQIGGGNVSHADPAVKIDGKPLKEGYIALQSESHPVEFRKVSLYNLAPYMNKPKQLASVLKQLKVRK
ncbi:DUF1080 domain-containing protein [Fibrella sp. USSR17]